jgi:hypothetical protein
MMNWSEYKREFSWDGSWRDIYVLNTKIDDWQDFINLLRNSEFPVDGLPDDLPSIFSDAEIRPLLTINVGGVTLNCHFFRTEEIELDLDPREVTEVEKANELFRFMEAIGCALRKPVRMTPENLKDRPIFEFWPETGKVSYFPCETDT